MTLAKSRIKTIEGNHILFHNNNPVLVRTAVLTVMAMKVIVFWDIMMYSLIEFSDILEERTASSFRVEE